jgi:hypothetical protein
LATEAEIENGGHSLDDDLRHFLKNIDINSFQGSPTLSGIADAGHAFGTWSGHHAMILSVMEDSQADRVIARLKDFRDRMITLQGGANISRARSTNYENGRPHFSQISQQ